MFSAKPGFNAKLSSHVVIHRRTNPLSTMIGVSLLPSVEISRHRNWHELCHVDNDGRGDPEVADAGAECRTQQASL